MREDAPYRQLEDTFGGRAGWTVAHSHSGFNAFRHHLLGYRTPQRPTLYREMAGNLVTARNVLDAVRERRIDVGPLDAYWHMLIARHAPQLCEGVRVLSSTALAPMPAFVAAADVPVEVVARLRVAFTGAAATPWFAELADPLCSRDSRRQPGQGFDPALNGIGRRGRRDTRGLPDPGQALAAGARPVGCCNTSWRRNRYRHATSK